MWCCVGCNEVYADELDVCPTCAHPGRWYHPTEDEIAAACARVRAGWDDADEQRRIVDPGQRRIHVDVRSHGPGHHRKARGSEQRARE